MSEQSEQVTRPLPAQSDAVALEVGHEELEHGRVRVDLRGDGSLTVEKLLEGKAEHFEHRLDPSRAEEAIRRADALGRLAPREDRQYTPVPDEPRYRIEVRLAGKEPYSVEVWRGELESYEEARGLVQELGTAVQRASDGKAVL